MILSGSHYICEANAYFTDLQERLCDWILRADPKLEQQDDLWERAEGGGGRSRVFTNGKHIEKAGINRSAVYGSELPASASLRRPQLTGQPFHAMGVSVVIHPLNPYIPSTHMNVRFFLAGPKDESPAVWWFGGGFDLSPYYGFEEDARSWHRAAQAAVEPWGKGLYARFKKQCDEYFRLPHRAETRGIGGLFFDDYKQAGWKDSFGLTRAVGDAFAPAFDEILQRRKELPWGKREREWQLWRRGRYVEFNLLYDRGTLFGLQSGGRCESILMSLPPLVSWKYNYRPQAGGEEARLLDEFLQPRDWLETTP